MAIAAVNALPIEAFGTAKITGKGGAARIMRFACLMPELVKEVSRDDQIYQVTTTHLL